MMAQPRLSFARYSEPKGGGNAVQSKQGQGEGSRFQGNDSWSCCSCPEIESQNILIMESKICLKYIAGCHIPEVDKGHQRGRSGTISSGSIVTVNNGEVARCGRFHNTVEPRLLGQGLTARTCSLLERHSDDVPEAGNAKGGIGDT